MKRRSASFRLFLRGLIALLLVFVLAGWLAVGASPRIEVQPSGAAIGRKTLVTVTVAEPRRGLSRITVDLEQNGARHRLAEKTYEPRPFWAPWADAVEHDELRLEVGKASVPALAEGTATLHVEAARAGTWLRDPAPASLEIALPVVLTPPNLSVLSTQHNVAQGGSGAVVYRLSGNATRDGVRAGEWFFPGSALPGGAPGTRFALFGIPWDLADPGAVRLLAEDAAGNASERSFLDRFAARPPRPATLSVDDAFLARVVPEILGSTTEVREQADLLASYLAINGELRRKNNQRLRTLAAATEPGFLWRRPFRQLPGSAVMASFADRRTYLYQGRKVDQQDHLGFDLATFEKAPVAAANRGKVVLAEYFGIYGNTVVLDHGYGLGSLYSHLSSIDVEPGQMVEPGQRLGATGKTGLAGGDHLHFSMLLHGLPVNPVEWWDPRWLETHLSAKLGTALPLDPR
ncbi:MAG TPA: M23 family metallopeptidase [Thermoanaerobaculia bacterium]|nr:M23 family metallopeptidase [Thermoanaerobaculia bacterium]